MKNQNFTKVIFRKIISKEIIIKLYFTKYSSFSFIIIIQKYKTAVACGMINKYLSSFPDGKIIWHTKLKDILKIQEHNNDIVVNCKCKYIVNSPRLATKYKNNLNSYQLIITNSHKLQKVLSIYKPTLVITDECHDITADIVYGILIELKKQNVIQIGLSATPVKEIKKSYARCVELYDKHFIYSLTDAIEKNYLVPFELRWIQVPEKLDSYDIIENMTDEVLQYIQQYPKTICWTDTINVSNKWFIIISKSGRKIINIIRL